MVHDHSPDTIYLSGALWSYKDGPKTYLMECCLESYLVGTNNHYITLEQQTDLCETYKGLIYKTLVIDFNQYKVYALKESKLKSTKRIKFSRQIYLEEYQGAYGIYTNTQLKKLLDAKPKALPMRPCSAPMGDTDMETNDLGTYVYLLQDRTAIAANANVYKIGKTTQPNFERFKSYPKGYKVYLLMACTNCHTIETTMLNRFRGKYIARPDYDTESFEGDLDSMMIDICEIVFGRN